MDRQIRPLRPAGRGLDSSNLVSNASSKPLTPKRPNVGMACEPCRRKKTKCDGQRPACLRCQSLTLQCEYEVEQGSTSRSTAIRAKNAQLLEENTQLKELYRMLRQTSEVEAAEILSRIRSPEDPIAVLNFVKEASLLLRGSPAPGLSNTSSDMNSVEAQAREKSAIVVPAHPWTTIAGDGLVSEMITSFFAWDDAFFYPFLDQECFLNDMRNQDAKNSKFCSPFLVNVICAYTSDSARKVLRSTGVDLKQRFLNEAKTLLELEAGRASLCTVQGLALLFTISAYNGTDRAGLIYRYTACTMLKSLKLEKKVARLRDSEPTEAREKRAICTALWGLFCFESIVAYVYLQPSLSTPPNVPRPNKWAAVDVSFSNLDILGDPFHSNSHGPPIVHGTFDAICDISELLYEVMTYNAENTGETGSESDVGIRRSHYAKLGTLGRLLPDRLQDDKNFTPQTCFLRVYFDVVAYNILRPLHPASVFEAGSVSVKDVLIRHCAFDIAVLEQYVQRWHLREYSCMFLCGAYSTALTLVSLLWDHRVHGMFAQACYFLRSTSRHFAMSRYIMQGLMALAWTLKQPIPQQSQVFFEGLGPGKEDLHDVPVGFIIPQYDEISEFLSDDGKDSQDISGQMGVLLSRWSALSL